VKLSVQYNSTFFADFFAECDQPEEPLEKKRMLVTLKLNAFASSEMRCVVVEKCFLWTYKFTAYDIMMLYDSEYIIFAT